MTATILFCAVFGAWVALASPTFYRIRMDHASARALVAQLEAAMSTSITLDTVADDTERPS